MTAEGDALAPWRAERGSYQVPGLGARKRAVLVAGGDLLDVAVAMLETEGMLADYLFGDGKALDAANFGVFKQNWGMIRSCVGRFRGLTAADYRTGAELNTDLRRDVKTLKTCQRSFGIDLWFAGHRNGATGLRHPQTADIAAYRRAVLWIRDRIESRARYQTDDTRFWVHVPAI